MIYKDGKLILSDGIAALRWDGPGTQPDANTFKAETSLGTYTLVRQAVSDSRVQRFTYAFKPYEACEIERFSLVFECLPDAQALWPEAKNAFHWIPNIKSDPAHFAGGHVFRSPVVILSGGPYAAALIPDLDDIAANQAWQRFLDLRFSPDDTAPPVFEYGIASQKPHEHVYYKPDAKKYRVDPAEGIYFSFTLLTFTGCTDTAIVRHCADYLWQNYGAAYTRKLLPQTVPFAAYARYGYTMALDHLWQPGPTGDSGGITLVTFKRDDGVFRGREYADDLWFHAWFNNMRTAFGMAGFGHKEKADAIARLLVSAPQANGLFPTIYAPHAENPWMKSSKHHGGGADLYSLPDCAWAALWLRGYISVYGDIDGASSFLARFRDGLLALLHDSGGFPCWVQADGFTPVKRLHNTASSALPAWFLGEELLANSVQPEQYESIKTAVTATADFIIQNVIPQQRFDDFELYYSCSRKPLDFYDPITCLYGQNTLAMQWCAECLRVTHLLTGDPKYLDSGIFCLSLLSLYQQVWDNPGLDFYTFGGFGVMNTDGEWQDARQAQFAETFMHYYDVTGDFSMVQRAVAAARAAFALMIIPENETVCPRNYQGDDTNANRQGGSAENYGHDGHNERSGQSGFHWGVGSALTTALLFKAKYGDIFVDLKSQAAIGIDGIAVEAFRADRQAVALTITTLAGIDRLMIRVVSDGHIPPLVINDGAFKVAALGNGYFHAMALQ